MKLSFNKIALKFILIILFYSINWISYAEDVIKHTINYEANGIVFQYVVIFQKIYLRTNPHITYYWHMNGQLQSNDGDYSGNILHGIYKEFDKSGKMLKKGYMLYGKKDREWKSWNSEGELIIAEKWKKGFLKKKIYFEKNGFKIEKYKHNKLNGRTKTILNGKRVSIEKYKKGIQIINEKPKVYPFLRNKNKKLDESDGSNNI